MSSAKRINKEDIIEASFSCVREKGIEGVNAREIAKRLNCSVQPIFYRFKNMEELKQEVLDFSLDYYKKFGSCIKVMGNTNLVPRNIK